MKAVQRHRDEKRHHRDVEWAQDKFSTKPKVNFDSLVEG